MTSLELALGWTNLVLLVAAGVLLRSYLPAYAKEKARNLATKEDVAEITRQVETVKASINQETALLERRREVYERITDALRVFISGHGASDNGKESFHAAYSACWLWAPDDLLDKLNVFLDMQIENTAKPGAYSQDKVKEVFGEIIILMRRNAGFECTKFDYTGYRFVRF